MRRNNERALLRHQVRRNAGEQDRTMTDIERQRIAIMATTAIAALVWAIANLV